MTILEGSFTPKSFNINVLQRLTRGGGDLRIGGAGTGLVVGESRGKLMVAKDQSKNKKAFSKEKAFLGSKNAYG